MLPLTEKQHAAIGAFWQYLPNMRAVAAEFHAAGFTVAFSCMSWRELRAQLPDMAEVIGRSMIERHMVLR